MITSVNRTEKTKAEFADVIIHLYDHKEQPLSDFNTHAGDFSAWAVGWDPSKDSIVLFSSDIGNAAYRIENGRLKAVRLNDELNKRAIHLSLE